MLKALSILEIFEVLSWFLEKWLEKKVIVNWKIYDVTGWTTNNYNKHIARYLKK